MHLDVHYKTADSGKTAKIHDGKVLNISAAGVYIYTHDILPINSRVDLEFTLPDPHVVFQAEGNVVWLADKQLQPHSSPGMGVAFSHLSNEKERTIVDFIDKNTTYRSDDE
jgi:uncharacterized protein (TIGR02266 family)